MIWETIEVPKAQLSAVIASVRRTGGTITHCVPHGDQVAVTYYVVLPVVRGQRWRMTAA
jgi:hypothetical protein